mmetsp:Transcript_97998/g.210202  ORF Transcript_97998/g.210202 Transcript_97998/m.210202 type:complete len:244 (+) Transcript_97998:715-1446(+)
MLVRRVAHHLFEVVHALLERGMDLQKRVVFGEAPMELGELLMRCIQRLLVPLGGVAEGFFQEVEALGQRAVVRLERLRGATMRLPRHLLPADEISQLLHVCLPTLHLLVHLTLHVLLEFVEALVRGADVEVARVALLLEPAINFGGQFRMHSVLVRLHGQHLRPKVCKVMREGRCLLTDELQLRLVQIHLPLVQRLDLPLPLLLPPDHLTPSSVCGAANTEAEALHRGAYLSHLRAVLDTVRD